MKKSLFSAALACLSAMAFVGCANRSDTYDDLSDARASHVFEKGWLPDILPASAYNLKVVTTVEIAAGRGRFRFDQKDYPAFSKRLSDYNGELSKVDEDNESIKRLIAAGYQARSYSLGATDWIFLCDQKVAICEFFVWQ